MNNLEKYVLSLTKEDYIKLISECTDCHDCPAFDLCNQMPEGRCEDILEKWASMEAPQDEEGNI